MASLVKDDDDLMSSSTKRSIPDSVSCSSEIIAYVGWTTVPHAVYATSRQTAADIESVLTKGLCMIGVDAADLPQVPRSIPFSIKVTPFKGAVEPEPKPNLMVCCATIMMHAKKVNLPTSAEELLKALMEFDIIAPRNPLMKLLCNYKWTLYASQPLPDGPVFIERPKSYDTNPGSIGMLFKKELVNFGATMSSTKTPSKFHRLYTVCKARIGRGLRLALTGHVNCVDAAGFPVKITTRPQWKPPANEGMMRTLVQCKLDNMATVVTGTFQSADPLGSRNGPIMFKREDVAFDSVEAFELKVSKANASDVGEIFVCGEARLRQIQCQCMARPGKVFRVTGGAGITVRMRQCEDFDFPITAASLYSIAEACAAIK